MPIDLPAPIAAYFAADKGDGDAVAGCFTDAAVVKDEGRTYFGRAAIATWRTETSAKYNYSNEPIAIEEKDGRTVVTCRLIGDFPGSPVNLRYFFLPEGDKIAALEIVP
jgi:hypothetical protein